MGYADNCRVLFSEEEISERISCLANRISRDYEGREVVFVGVLNGAFMFFSDLLKKLEIPCEIDFLRAESYLGKCSSGQVTLKTELKNSVNDKHVVVVEDILDTGRTLEKIVDELKKSSPLSVKTAVLCDKPSRRVNSFKADYVCFEVEDLFLVGFGLDYNEKYRNLPFIGVYEG